VEPAHRFAAALSIRITVEHVGGEVLGARVVDGVHADRFGAVVLRHVDLATEAYFQPGAGAATTAEEVHDDLIVLRVEGKAEDLFAGRIRWGLFSLQRCECDTRCHKKGHFPSGLATGGKRHAVRNHRVS
jgi:hypothetical protein